MQRSDPTAEERAPSPGAGRTGWYSWAVVGMLWFICFFNYADRQAIFSIFPKLEEEFGFSKFEQGLIGSAFSLIYALSAPFAGQIGDTLSRKRVILTGLYVWSIVTGFTSLCGKVWQFVLVRGAEGLGETFYFPASMSLISDYHAKATRSRAMSLHQTSVYAGTIGGGALAGWMGQYYGWQSPFVALGAGGVVLGLVLAAFIREPHRNQAERLAEGQSLHEPTAHSTAISQMFAKEPGRVSVRRYVSVAVADLLSFVSELRTIPSARLLVAAFFGANFVGLIFLSWMPSFLKQEFGLSLAWAGVSSTVFLQVASMIGAMSGGVLADWWRSRNSGGRMLVQAIGTLCGAPFIVLCGTTLELGTLVVAMTFFGFFKGMYDSNIWASLYDVVPAERRGTAVGFMNMVGWMGGFLGPIVVGFVVDRGVSMGMAIASTAVIYVLVFCILVYAAWRAPRSVAAVS
jgi:MFS family permease